MVLITMAVAYLAGKWLAASAAAGYGSYKTCRMILDTPEISLPEGQVRQAEEFEARRADRHPDDDEVPGFATLEDLCGMEGEVGHIANRNGAREAAGFYPTNRGSAFMRYWVAELRLEFPQRANRPSDRAVMSKWLAGKLREHGVRTMHMANMVPRCVALALNPSRAEIEADQEAEAARVRTLGQRAAYKARRWLRLASPSQQVVGC
jgi:hypothetical protein